MFINGCTEAQQKNNNNKIISAKSNQTGYSPIDFMKYNCIGRIDADTLGKLHFDVCYKSNSNNAGNAKVFMIHKNGGRWWYNYAKKMYPNERSNTGRFLSHYLVAEHLMKEDSTKLKEYNKWAFFIDKKDLIKEYEAGEDGNPKAYYTMIDNSEYEAILYQQLAGENKWIELERRRFKTGDKFKEGDPYLGSWETDFINNKLKESNEKK